MMTDGDDDWASDDDDDGSGRNSVEGDDHGGGRRPSRFRAFGTRRGGTSAVVPEGGGAKAKYYRQDLVLKSQRVLAGRTGIMKYSQNIVIDKIGKTNYSVSIDLDDDSSRAGERRRTPATIRPFESLSVHVGLEQDGDDVTIHANGIMKVNRKVVPHLIVFDASGIAGSMAGKGTLWLSAYFEERRKRFRDDERGGDFL
mmetsp:Transcript_17787/g.22106  ORF Transcript_17787/g.22106 Transcript_17787/m.22106 type:complete len:199 (+) Transcript_17787:3-599(+)